MVGPRFLSLSLTLDVAHMILFFVDGRATSEITIAIRDLVNGYSYLYICFTGEEGRFRDYDPSVSRDIDVDLTYSSSCWCCYSTVVVQLL
jgi:hypothetical protein